MILRSSIAPARKAQGSALLPVVAAMLILMLCGVALSEVFGAQRMQSVMNIEAARASWIAEAGLWHAAHEKTVLTTPVPFAGGSYTVSKQASTYTSAGVMDEATNLVMRKMWPAEGPLDVEATVSTVKRTSDKKFKMNLISIWPEDVVIESFELNNDSGEYGAHRFKHKGSDIWHEHSGIDVPTGLTALNKGSTSKRTVKANASTKLEFQSHEKPDDTINYTLILHFTNGTQSTLAFSIEWDD